MKMNLHHINIAIDTKVLRVLTKLKKTRTMYSKDIVKIKKRLRKRTIARKERVQIVKRKKIFNFQ